MWGKWSRSLLERTLWHWTLILILVQNRQQCKLGHHLFVVLSFAAVTPKDSFILTLSCVASGRSAVRLLHTGWTHAAVVLFAVYYIIHALCAWLQVCVCSCFLMQTELNLANWHMQSSSLMTTSVVHIAVGFNCFRVCSLTSQTCPNVSAALVTTPGTHTHTHTVQQLCTLSRVVWWIRNKPSLLGSEQPTVLITAEWSRALKQGRLCVRKSHREDFLWSLKLSQSHRLYGHVNKTQNHTCY